MKIKLTMHSFSSSLKVIGFLPDFFDSFICISTPHFFAKLVTISFFLRSLLGNALSVFLRERCFSVFMLKWRCRGFSFFSSSFFSGWCWWRLISLFQLYLLSELFSLTIFSLFFFVLLFVAIFSVLPFKLLPFFVLLSNFDLNFNFGFKLMFSFLKIKSSHRIIIKYSFWFSHPFWINKIKHVLRVLPMSDAVNIPMNWNSQESSGGIDGYIFFLFSMKIVVMDKAKCP